MGGAAERVYTDLLSALYDFLEFLLGDPLFQVLDAEVFGLDVEARILVEIEAGFLSPKKRKGVMLEILQDYARDQWVELPVAAKSDISQLSGERTVLKFLSGREDGKIFTIVGQTCADFIFEIFLEEGSLC